jgi:hypothetical protein
MGALHVIDTALGILCLVYGGMVSSAEVTAATISMGLVLVIGSLCGAIGYSTASCNRGGLLGSAVFGLLASLLYIAAFVGILVYWDGFVKFMKDNSADLMLNEGSVGSIEGLKILFAVLTATLALVEGYRFFAMRKIRTGLLRNDPSDRVAPLMGRSISTEASSRSKGFLSWLGLTKRKKCEDFVMFDDNASMESSLLWSGNGGQPSSDDYLEFVPEHERGLANYTSNVALPTPPEDRVDY